LPSTVSAVAHWVSIAPFRREDHRGVSNGVQVKTVATLAMAAPVSVDWCGYWQRAAKKAA
jgi:hypothetical protein